MAEDFSLAHYQMEVPPLTSKDDHSCSQLPSPYVSIVNTFEGHQQSQIDQYFTTCAAPSSNTTSGSDQFLPTLSSLQSHMEWSGKQATDYQFSPNESYYGLSSIKKGEISHNQFYVAADGLLPYVGLRPYGHNTRTAQSFHIDTGMMLEFQTFSPEEACLNDMPRAHTVTYDVPKDAAELANFSRSPTAESDCFTASCSTSEYPTEITEGPSSMTSAESSKDDLEGSASAAKKRTSEEPYAKLIYRALLSTPNHSMVLQEIYQWFLENTNKGKSMSTGWRNSIRHNLSMNAVCAPRNLVAL